MSPARGKRAAKPGKRSASGKGSPSKAGGASGAKTAGRSKAVRLAFLIAGHLCVGLAVLGVILPIMPATVFLILAAACYARGSEKFYDWLLGNKWFGPPIKDWQKYHAMTVKAKVVGIVSLLAGIGVSVTFFVHVLWLRLVLAGTALGVTVLILLIKTKKT